MFIVATVSETGNDVISTNFSTKDFSNKLQAIDGGGTREEKGGEGREVHEGKTSVKQIQ